MWDDNETPEDFLGFQVHADLIKKVVLNPRLLPVTIGVFGDWGSGKSSIMKMLQQDLDPSDIDKNPKKYPQLEGVAILYFNGWLFEGYDDAKSALLTSIISQLAEHKRFGPKLCDSAKGLLQRIRWMRALKWGFREIALPIGKAWATGGLTIPTDLKGAAEKLLTHEKDAKGKGKKEAAGKEGAEKDDAILAPEKSDPADVRSFREEFETMLTKSDIKTLVVLIDDLDRCSPERIIDNLEAIKLFLNTPSTAFVIGADPRIVRHAIAVRYKDIRGDEIQALAADPNLNERLIDDYLEKLIQIPYHLPRLSRAEIETYMTLLFCKRDLSATQLASCLTAWKEQWKKNRYDSFCYSSVREALKKDFPSCLEAPLTLCAGTASMVAEGLNGNPRQVKRFLNAFFLRRELAESSSISGLRDDVLMKLMLLEYYKLTKFRELFNWQAAEKGYPKALAALEKSVRGAADGTPVENLPADKTWTEDLKLRQWLTMEPPLAEVDLRDYFWLARDRLQSTLGSLALIPPLVKRIYESLLGEATTAKAAEQSKALPENELTLLYELLSTHLARKVDDLAAHRAYQNLILKDVDKSANAYLEILTRVPVASIPPNTPVDIDRLAKTRASFKDAASKILERFRSSPETRAGKAAQQLQKP